MEATTHVDKSQSLAAEHKGFSPVNAGSPSVVSRLEPFVDAEAAANPISFPGVVDAILEVSRQRKLLFDQLKSALKSGDDAEALLLARRLCGLPE